MRIGIPKEIANGETRVAATPTTVPKLIKLGYTVVVESGAGVNADFSDDAYTAAGAEIGTDTEVWASDLILTVNEPADENLKLAKAGSTVVSFFGPRQRPEVADKLASYDVTAMSMDMVPRISRAQSLDALSSMSNISGYRAVVEASHAFGRFFNGQVTAAGKIPPAKVLVIGAGVAGLAAIGAAKSMGAIVRATDTRPEVAEQIESMGGEFLSVENVGAEVSTDGYAKEMSDDYNKRAARLYSEQAPQVDVIITTAAIPGRPSPKLITKEMVESMKPGSVIVDLAAAGGGNCELTRPGESYVTENKVTIVGYLDVPKRMPAQASELYGNNLVNLVKLLTPGKDGEVVVNFEDEVLRSMTIARRGEVTFPPPATKVSAAPKKPAAAPAPAAETEAKPKRKPLTSFQKFGMVIGAAALWIVISAVLPLSFLQHVMVFGLACIVGYYVISAVEPALYTPLMSVSNAVSGITIVGAITQLTNDAMIIRVVAFLALVIAGINMFGGFAITYRMLGMFKKEDANA